MENYFNCSKCDIWIPVYSQHIHQQECHRKFACSNAHPYIREGYILSRVCIIEKRNTQNESSPQKLNRSKNSEEISSQWIVCKEPDGIERLQSELSEKYAFFNTKDLLRSRIEAFTPVSLHSKELKTLFLAVPNDKMQIGTIGLYKEGILNHFQISKDVVLVAVTKIMKSEMADNINLKVSSPKERGIIEKMFKKKYNLNYEFGHPCFLPSKGTLSLQNEQKSPIQVDYSISSGLTEINSSLCYDNLSSLAEEPANINLSLNDSSKCNTLSSTISDISHRLENLDLSQVDASPHGNSSLSFRTSTPRRNEQSSCKTPNQSDKKKIKRNKDKTMSSTKVSFSEEAPSTDTLYWVSQNTRVTVAQDEFILSREAEKPSQYFKTEVYYELKNLVQKKLKWSEARNSLCCWTGILLSGLPGTGKTKLAEELSTEMNIPLVCVTLLGWSEVSFDSNYFEDCFNQAKNSAPSILLFDELDSLCHLEEGTKNRTGIQSSHNILKIIQKVKNVSKPVILIGTTNQPQSLADRLRHSGRFDKEIVLPLPEPETRFSILCQILDSHGQNIKEEVIRKLALNAAGFSGADLESAVRVAWQNSVLRWKRKKEKGGECLNLDLQDQDLEQGIDSVVPYYLRQNYSAVSKVAWSDIMGYEAIKGKFRNILDVGRTTDDPRLKGVLLYGPPGCSKTMLVRALVTETRFTFFPVKCSDLLSKYVGETEKLMCGLFERAAHSSPSLIFMDEIDSLCRERTGTGGGNSVVPELLSLLQNSMKKSSILVIGATNRPQDVDEALFSPGCLELLLHVDLPDCPSRCSIWEGLLKDVPTSGIHVGSLCAATEGFSCAEICALYQKATHSLLASLHSGEAHLDQLKITQDLLTTVISSTSHRTPKSLLASIDTFKKSFRNRLCVPDN